MPPGELYPPSRVLDPPLLFKRRYDSEDERGSVRSVAGPGIHPVASGEGRKASRCFPSSRAKESLTKIHDCVLALARASRGSGRERGNAWHPFRDREARRIRARIKRPSDSLYAGGGRGELGSSILHLDCRSSEIGKPFSLTCSTSRLLDLTHAPVESV